MVSQFPDHPITTEFAQRSHDTGLISLSCGGGTIKDEEEYPKAASSLWLCSSQGRVCRDEIVMNEETEDTVSSVGAKTVTSVDDANSKEVLLSTSMKKENAAEGKRSTDSPSHR